MKNGTLIMKIAVFINIILFISVFILVIYSSNSLPRYYSLTDVKGKNYVTSLKQQGLDSKLCWSFAEAAAAETYLLKNHASYVENVLGKKIYDNINREDWTKKNDDEISLSVAHNAMTMFVSPRDKYGNAGRSRSLPSNKYPSYFWGKIRANESMLATNLSTWTTLVLEDSLLDWEKNKYQMYLVSLIDSRNDEKYFENYLDKTVVNAESAIIHMYRDYMVNNTYDETNTKKNTDKRYVNDMKKAIYEDSGVILMLRYSGFEPDKYYDKEGSTNFGNCSVYRMSNVTNEGSYEGHVLYAIGWDDDIELASENKISKGAIICKDSRNIFSLVPYDFNWTSMINDEYSVYTSFLDIKWMKPKYDNIYYYDSGNSDKIFRANERVISDTNYSDERYAYANPMYKSLINTFEIKNSECLKAVSYFSTTPTSNMELSIYKLPDENIDSIKNMEESNLLYRGNYKCYLGLNSLPINKDICVKKGDYLAIKLKTTDLLYLTFGLDLTFCVTDEFIYRSQYKGKSYLTDINGDSFYGIFDKNSDKLLDVKEYTENDKRALDGLKNTISENYDVVSIKDYLGDENKGNLRIKLITNNI